MGQLGAAKLPRGLPNALANVLWVAQAGQYHVKRALQDHGRLEQLPGKIVCALVRAACAPCLRPASRGFKEVQP